MFILKILVGAGIIIGAVVLFAGIGLGIEWIDEQLHKIKFVQKISKWWARGKKFRSAVGEILSLVLFILLFGFLFYLLGDKVIG